MVANKREPRIYRLFRARSGQPWVKVRWPERYGREQDRYLIRTARTPFPWDWGTHAGLSCCRLGEVLLLHALGSSALALEMGTHFGNEFLAKVPFCGMMLDLRDIHHWLQTRDKGLVDQLLTSPFGNYEQWELVDLIHGPLGPSHLIL